MSRVQPHVVPPKASRSRIALTLHELRDWGRRMGASSEPPLVVAITGDLGAGKTTLVQAICDGYGVTEEVTSPTFALVHEYSSPRGSVFHLDLYRLRDPAELTNLGWDDIVSSRALILVEWAERAGDRLPDDVVPIELEHVPGDDDHRILLAG
jgi:tRNA threonylcarbamoyladenosine biosynthesis protein TsaE